MLAVTEQAATAIDDILATRGELPEEAGVRIAMQADASAGDSREPTFSLEVVEAPAAGDEVLEGTPVFLEPEAAGLLDDKMLDADLSGEQVRFAVKAQV